tara:strand:- start:932 stop:1546 length:615 start_codon:yes stop_codon:yes gene_type:complete
MAILNSATKFIAVANQKADQLTAGAKAILCLPSIISGLPDLGKGIIGSALANIGSALEGFASTVSGIVTNTINGAVNKITGSITDVIDKITDTLGEVGSAIEAGKEFVQGIKDKAKDVADFTAEKENCNFAAASLLNCIVSEALGSVSAKGAIDIAKGLKPIDDFANDISDTISGPIGSINRTVDKAAGQINRATNLISKANLF